MRISPPPPHSYPVHEAGHIASLSEEVQVIKPGSSIEEDAIAAQVIEEDAITAQDVFCQARQELVEDSEG